MATINFTVNDHSIRVDNLIELAQGSNNFDICNFAFDSSWDGYTKYGIFYQKPEEAIKVALSNNSCNIPAEVLKNAGRLYIGARGVLDGSHVATTQMVSFLVRNGSIDGSTGATEEITASEYEIVMAAVNKVNARIDNLIANNNDTEGNSELVDIRIGANGETYPSAGTAVREQISKLYEQVNTATCIKKYGCQTSYGELCDNATLTEYDSVNGSVEDKCYRPAAGETMQNKWLRSTADQVPAIYLANGVEPPDGASASNLWGVYFLNKTDLKIQECVFENMTGVHLEGSDTIDIENTFFKGAENAIFLKDTSGVMIKNCTLEMNTTGLMEYYQGFYFGDGNTDVTIDNCKLIAKGTIRNAFRSGSANTTGEATNNVTIKNCFVLGSFANAFQNIKGTDITFNNCVFVLESISDDQIRCIVLDSGDQYGETKAIFNSCIFSSADGDVVITNSERGNDNEFNNCRFYNIPPCEYGIFSGCEYFDSVYNYNNLYDEVQDLKKEVSQLSEEMENLDVRSITSIVKTSTEGLVDTYTIYFSDGTTQTFAVTNGSVDEAAIQQYINDWLNANPGTTTTVQDGAITMAKLSDDVRAKLDSVKPQWAEFPRATNPARDIYNSVSMTNAKVLGTDGTLRHNMMIEGNLITWTESTSNVDYADSSGATSVKLMGLYDYFGDGANVETPTINYSDVFDVFPSDSDIYGVDGAVIDTVVASSDSTIISLGSNNYIIMAGCQGASSYHIVYRTVTYERNVAMTFGDTINVLKINGAEWDMTTLRDDYTNKYSQLNTKVIKNNNIYYMAMVQSGIGIAIMKSSDGLDWSLHYHIADTDCHLEACIGMVSWVSNNAPTVYVVVRHKYGDGYITLYGYQNINFSNLISKTYIPASTGRALLDSVNNSTVYLTYSVNGRKNAVIAQILPNSDGTTGISILETPKEIMSNYPTLYVNRSSSGARSAFFGGTNGLGSNKKGVSLAYLWMDNPDALKTKNEQLKSVMFGTSVEVIQTLTDGTEIGSVAGTKLYAPKASASSGGGTPTLKLLGSATVSEDTGSVDFEFETALNLKKILVYAHTIGVSDFSGNGRGEVYINSSYKVADGLENAAFKSGAERYMLFEIDLLSDCTVGKAYSETIMGSGYASERVAFLMGTDINANTDITKISFLANQFVDVGIASGTTISVYGY